MKKFEIIIIRKGEGGREAIDSGADKNAVWQTALRLSWRFSANCGTFEEVAAAAPAKKLPK